ncbi:MAG: Arylsulfatase [Planctomycetota bacterium]
MRISCGTLMLNVRIMLLSICWILLNTGFAHVSLAVEVPRPKAIVVILADDLGYGDMQCNAPRTCRIKTPNMDRLAAGGLRFTDGHSSSGCCSPSRYTLLTGRYHWRTSLQSGIVGVWGKPLISETRLTIAELARRQGYRTACFGKWHLGHDWPIEPELLPLFNGFGGQAGGGGQVTEQISAAHRQAWQAVFSQRIPGGPITRGFDEYFGTDVPNWPPYCFIEGDRTVGIPDRLLPAENFVKNQASLQGPALENWSLQAVLPALAERAERFIQQQSAAQQPFLMYLPLTSPHTPLAVNEQWRGRSGLNSDYADLVMETDAVVGRVLDSLEHAGLTEDTLVIFTSDNGCASYIGVPPLEAQGHFPSGPFRDYKASVYEGGHRVPFVIRWPQAITPGTVCSQLVHQADVMATLADILQVPLPPDAGEDSFSLLPLLQGGSTPVRTQSVNTACNGLPSYREGPWKLILQADAAAGTAVQLYNLDQDPREASNMAGREPERAAAMRQAFEQLIVAGRSTPGQSQKNDVRVTRYPKTSTPAAKARKKAKADPPPAEPAAAADEPQNLQIYVLMGQSNMAGRGLLEKTREPLHPKILMLTKEERWEPASEPLHFDKSIAGAGLGASFSLRMSAAEPQAMIGLVPCAVGGTPLSRWQKGADLYEQALKRIRAAQKAGIVRGVLWHQGENDALDLQQAESYGRRLAEMVNDLRQDTGNSQLPFVAGTLGDFLSDDAAGNPSHWRTVNAQLLLLPGLTSRTAIVDASGLKPKSDGVHFDTPSLRTLGERYATAMLKLQQAKVENNR